MPHPSDGDLLACLDGELERDEEMRVRTHLESCAECRVRADVLVREAERFSTALLTLDEDAASPADPGPLPLVAAAQRHSRHALRRTGWSLARAAGLILIAAGAAAALVPGSPVRAWLGELLAEAPPVPALRVDETPVPAEGGEAAPGAAIAVLPEDGRLVVSLRGFDRESNVHVRLSDSGRASVRVEGTDEGPRFVTGPGSLEVIGTDGGDIWVDLPRSASDALVQVDGAPALRIRDGRLRILRPVLDSLRGDVVFRIGE